MNEEQQVDTVLREVPPPEQVDPTQAPHVVLHPHGDPRNIGIIVLATLAVLAILKWADAFFIPLMLGFVFYYALSPIVDGLVRLRIPRAVGAAVLILGILGGSGAAIWSLADDANDLINSLPSAAQRLRDVVNEKVRRSSGPLEPMQKAAAELAKAAEDAGNNGAKPAPAPRGVQRVIVERPQFDLRDHLWSGTIGVASFIGQLTLVTFLTYFLLLSGDTFRRKLVKITGPGLSEKKVTVQALDEINAQMQRYLLVQLLASVGVGFATGAVFAMLGLKHAAVWGVAAGVLNLVPYIGSILVTIGAGIVAFIQGGDIELPLMVVGSSLLINTVEGNLLVPWLTSKASRMNAVSVFIGVLFWGWLWGVWGLLLGIPIMMVVKAICDRVDHLKPVGELLGT
ncbi:MULTISPECIES: AI-2E family transporter [Ramlibacter]|uniref:AI-2E family transporter n=1 Tax=Ramlibacter pinisoli TaxID=2682844 RepID=A0A6N8IQN4_9BURK|nr:MULTISPECIES: AI-2E family transporter [Ramlibacter]MBA2964191.1 AI-2E family transporter [Ramlibacter sp. CGMCC 1.13660]MVQ29157.1 AI-2E family transporter [Ramlibacter pinisoli]